LRQQRVQEMPDWIEVAARAIGEKFFCRVRCEVQNLFALLAAFL
jgi:hypothetical protein